MTEYDKKGTLRINSNGDLVELSKIWSSKLREFNIETLEKSLKHCFETFKFSPTLNEFYDVCRRIKKGNDFNVSDISNYRKKEDVSVTRIIDEGAIICKRLKEMFPEKRWMEISALFKRFKTNTKHYYPGMNDLNFILELQKYTNDDILDALKCQRI